MGNLDNIILAISCFLMGAALAGGIVYLRGRNMKNEVKDEPANPDLVEMARIYRSRKSRRLFVAMDKQTFSAANQLSDDQQQRLSITARVLQSWLAEAKPVPAAPPAPVQPSQPSTGSIADPSGAAAFATAEIKPVPQRPLEAIDRLMVPDPAKAAPQFQSIAAQINDVLQERLPGSPYDGQGIALVETPDQGVVVRIGMDEYPGVEAVPDPEVRSFVKAAVAEWEARTRQGIR